MSFTKLPYDAKAYKSTVQQSQRQGSYHLNKPRVSATQCYPYPVSVIPQQQGVSVFKNTSLVDVSSELLGINRRASGAPTNTFEAQCDTGYPLGQGIIGNCPNSKKGSMVGDNELQHFPNCFIPAEETRTTNPSCNLRGTGWNRWESLSINPQKNIEMSFPNNISNRILVKDNHRPLIPTPIDVSASLPDGEVKAYDGEFAIL
tara:strand:+ start:478 stop:1086 length:609 start_codon:yes stop_codon:yes gene_type:complete